MSNINETEFVDETVFKKAIVGEVFTILGNLLKQLTMTNLFDSLSFRDNILHYQKQIALNKIREDKTLIRVYRQLEKYNKELLAENAEVVFSNLFLLPEIDIAVVYHHVDFEKESKTMILKYLSTLKCYLNIYFDVHVEKTRTVMEKIFTGFMKPIKLSTQEELSVASAEIKKMMGGSVNSKTTNMIFRLVDQIGAGLGKIGEESFDIPSLLQLASSIADENRADFQEGVDLQEITTSATTMMSTMLKSDNKDTAELKDKLGFDPMELFKNLDMSNKNGQTPDIGKFMDNNMSKLNPEQKQQMENVIKGLGGMNFGK